MSDTPETPDHPEPPEADETRDADEAVAEDAAEGEAEDRVVEPDHPDTVAALQDIGARSDVNQDGRIWRIFFYERNTDEHLSHIHGLEDLKEVWLLGSKVTRQGAAELRERLPGVKVYS